ncbi:MAG TPA: spermidine/putrescine ABC transporter substrate-binding protein [Streptosporangiaceae bacterium]|jgi:spermidine/putrescine transport system substrate-binding protein|nr:spermidine/putrescine ABC transporter substrate-binding protein [Streptosporangiaceae bacterium]
MTNSNDSASQNSGVDPSLVRGMTQSRLSRRQLLAGAGAGAGAFSIGAILAACGVQGTNAGGGGSTSVAGNVGTASWWAKQKLHNKVNFANWPYYLDVLKGKHPSLEHFTNQTGIQVAYTEPINDNVAFYAKIRPSLEAKQYTGFDIIVMTNNTPNALGYLLANNWLIPLDPTMMTNFNKTAGPLVKNPSWDPGNRYTMAWQSGFTTIAYNKTIVKNPGDSVDILFDRKYAGKIGMMSDLQELGSVGLLAIGVEPASSGESDWAKAAKKLQQQKSDGLVRAYYSQEYINHFKNGDTVVTQAWSGDIFQANLNSKYRDLVMMVPGQGMMFWTDNMCIPLYAENPKDAMVLMDYYYKPDVQAVVEYYNDYVCPVPSAKNVLLNPSGWAQTTLAAMKPSIGLATSVTANAPTVFPDQAFLQHAKNYYSFKSQEELTTWTNLFLPITQGA